jgi:ribonuclease HI
MATDYVAYGVYPDRASFESAIEALRAANFRNSDIFGDSSGARPDHQGPCA